MCIKADLPKGVMNLNGNFNDIAKEFVNSIKNNLDFEIEFSEKSSMRKGHSVLVLGAGTSKGDICTSYLYIYDDGVVYPNIVDDGVS